MVVTEQKENQSFDCKNSCLSLEKTPYMPWKRLQQSTASSIRNSSPDAEMVRIASELMKLSSIAPQEIYLEDTPESSGQDLVFFKKKRSRNLTESAPAIFRTFHLLPYKRRLAVLKASSSIRKRKELASPSGIDELILSPSLDERQLLEIVKCCEDVDPVDLLNHHRMRFCQAKRQWKQERAKKHHHLLTSFRVRGVSLGVHLQSIQDTRGATW